jgi:hypothetical protein
MTEVTYSRPDEPLPEDSLTALRAWLDVQRFGIVAAHHVVASYPEPDGSAASPQEELLFELDDSSEDIAPQALVMAASMEMPSLLPPADVATSPAERRSVVFGFRPASGLAAVRGAGTPVWAHDPARPRTEPSKVEFVYERPELPDGLVADVRALVEGLPHVQRAYFARECLLRDGREIWQRLNVYVEEDEEGAADPRASGLTQSLYEVLSTYYGNFGISWPDRDARRHGLVVFERDVSK